MEVERMTPERAHWQSVRVGIQAESAETRSSPWGAARRTDRTRLIAA